MIGRIILGTVAGVCLLVQPLQADVGQTDRGRELFESTNLGSTGKSCNGCHPGGKKLEWAGASYDNAKLASIVNRCIEKALKGKPLEPDGDDMKALVQHIRSFGSP